MARMRKWTPEAIAIAAKLWAHGVSSYGISQVLGVSTSGIIGICHRNRDLFPPRRKVEAVKKARPTPKAAPVASKLPNEGRVVRRTITGARVSMPHVTFIDGPAQRASA